MTFRRSLKKFLKPSLMKGFVFFLFVTVVQPIASLHLPVPYTRSKGPLIVYVLFWHILLPPSNMSLSFFVYTANLIYIYFISCSIVRLVEILEKKLTKEYCMMGHSPKGKCHR